MIQQQCSGSQQRRRLRQVSLSSEFKLQLASHADSAETSKLKREL